MQMDNPRLRVNDMEDVVLIAQSFAQRFRQADMSSAGFRSENENFRFRS
jgi:hypothetical protein